MFRSRRQKLWEERVTVAFELRSPTAAVWAGLEPPLRADPVPRGVPFGGVVSFRKLRA